MPRDAYTDIRKAYAKAMGVDVRTAQRHQKAKHPDWQRFLGNCAVEGVKRQNQEGGAMTTVETMALGEVSPLAPEEVPEWYSVDDAMLSPVQIAEKRAWRAHSRTFQTWLDMISGHHDPLVALAYVRELPKLQDNWHRARARTRDWEIETRLLYRKHEVEDFNQRFIGPVAEIMANLPAELAAVANPEDPAFARVAITDWQRTKLQRSIDALMEGSKELLEAA